MGNIVNKLAFPVPYPSHLGKDTIYIRFDQYRIPITYLPYKGSGNTGKTIIFSHGNASDLGRSREYLEFLRDLKTSVIGYEYLGYGHTYIQKPDMLSCVRENDSPEWEPYSNQYYPSEDGCYKSIRATYQWALSRSLKPMDIIFMGQSIGCGPTVDIASQLPECGGTILITPFTSAVKVVTESSAGYLFDFFQNDIKVEHINGPILIIHGDLDEVIPLEHSKQLAKTLEDKGKPCTTVWIEGANHNDIVMFEQCMYSLKEFIFN